MFFGVQKKLSQRLRLLLLLATLLLLCCLPGALAQAPSTAGTLPPLISPSLSFPARTSRSELVLSHRRTPPPYPHPAVDNKFVTYEDVPGVFSLEPLGASSYKLLCAPKLSDPEPTILDVSRAPCSPRSFHFPPPKRNSSSRAPLRPTAAREFPIYKISLLLPGEITEKTVSA